MTWVAQGCSGGGVGQARAALQMAEAARYVAAEGLPLTLIDVGGIRTAEVIRAIALEGGLYLLHGLWACRGDSGHRT